MKSNWVVQLEPMLVTRRDAAKALGTSLAAVNQLIHDGKLVCRIVGRRKLVPTWALRRFAGEPHERVVFVERPQQAEVIT